MRAASGPLLAAALLGAVATVSLAPHAAAQSEQEVNARLDALFGDHRPYRAFFAELQAAVAAGDRDALAAMIGYPLSVVIDGSTVTVASRPDFVTRFDRIFTAQVVAAIETQTYATLFARDQGVMIGSGEVWFSGICGETACRLPAVKIIGINRSEQ